MAWGREEIAEEDNVSFNMALALLKRIDGSFYELEYDLIKGNLVSSWRILISINNEIECFLSEAEITNLKEIEEKINKIINSIGNIDEVCNYHGHLTFSNVEQRNILYPLLVDYNRKLRKCMHSHNMMIPPESESGLF